MPCTSRMNSCRSACLHRQLVDDYHAARHAWWEAAEAATALYPAELAEYRTQNPPITFKDWLTGHRATRTEQQDRSAAA